MRLRLRLLQDPAVIEKQIEREMKEAEAKRKKPVPPVPTVRTEAEVKEEMEARKKERKEAEQHVKERRKSARIRPLSEAKAIETGANFISESFLFIVAASAILFESWRSRRKETNRHEGVQDRLDELESEREDMKAQISELQQQIHALLEQKPIVQTKARPASPPVPTPPPTADRNSEKVKKAQKPPENQK